jgi:predicted GIY-YIG superfamily endonuclease
MLKYHTYLLHFDPTYKHAGHYSGYCSIPIEKRLEAHQTGNGANLCKVAIESGCKLILADSWNHETMRAARDHEHLLKASHQLSRYCPICKKSRIIEKGKRSLLEKR